MKKVGIYIHIPFCKQKCYYCDFISYCNKDYLICDYVKCLKTELKEVASVIKYNCKYNNSEPVVIDTIYIGGGTPSYIDKGNNGNNKQKL